MARESSIKIYRSTGTSAPASLSAGELAWVDDGGAGTLYIGDATAGAVKTIGGAPGGDWGTALRTDTALLGTTTIAALTGGAGAFDLTASDATAATQATGNSSTKLATTAFVATAVSNAAPDMDAISDTDLANGGAVTDASFLVYDGVTNKWEDQRLSGDVSVDKNGNTSITSIPNGAVTMATDTDGAFVRTVTAIANETVVTLNASAAGAEAVIGLANNVTIPNNLTVTGDLTVSGTNTVVNTTTTSLADPVFKLGSDASPSDTKDRGIEIAYYNGSAKQGFFGMDDSDQKFKYWSDCTIQSNIVTAGSVGNVEFGTIDGTTIDASVELVAPLATVTSVVATNLTGTITSTSAAQPNVTTMVGLTAAANLETIGTITTGVWNGTTIAAANGGTGLSSYTAGDLVYADSGTTLTKLTATGNGSKMLKMNAGATAPEWSDEVDGGTFP